MGAAEKSRPHVEPETLEAEFLDKICTQHSVSIHLAEMENPASGTERNERSSATESRYPRTSCRPCTRRAMTLRTQWPAAVEFALTASPTRPPRVERSTRDVQASRRLSHREGLPRDTVINSERLCTMRALAGIERRDWEPDGGDSSRSNRWWRIRRNCSRCHVRVGTSASHRKSERNGRPLSTSGGGRGRCSRTPGGPGGRLRLCRSRGRPHGRTPGGSRRSFCRCREGRRRVSRKTGDCRRGLERPRGHPSGGRPPSGGSPGSFEDHDG